METMNKSSGPNGIKDQIISLVDIGSLQESVADEVETRTSSEHHDGEVADSSSSLLDNETLTKSQDTDEQPSNARELHLESAESSTDNEEDLSEPSGQESKKNRHNELIKKLRLQLRDLEKYAYERGELDEVPTSVLVERQSVILETLKERLSLSLGLDELETLKIDELKKQIDKEIHDLIDPLLGKDNLLKQLQTQLTDLEKYIDHLHGTLGEVHVELDSNSDDKSKSCSEKTCGANVTQINKSFPSVDNQHDSISKTSRLIKDLIAQIVCSDSKLQNKVAKLEQKSSNFVKTCQNGVQTTTNTDISNNNEISSNSSNDSAAWTLHIDKVILATDSLVNLYTMSNQARRCEDKQVDYGLVESVTRRQLVPAIRDLLSYGLIETNFIPRSSSYVSMIFDPYYILSTLTCFPNSQKTNSANSSCQTDDKIHIWSVIKDYYRTRNEPAFQSSSIRTLSQSFNLTASISGPIQITSKQALLIAVDEIIETLSKCKPNGPESHFKAFIYTALNRKKLSTWLRLVFKNKSIIKKYYHSFGFVYETEKMDKFLNTLEALGQFEFVLQTNVEPIEQYIGAF